MAKYKTIVPEIHCDGCVNLVKMTLEDHFQNVNVDKESREAKFESEETVEAVAKKVENAFGELKDHGYSHTEIEVEE